MRNLFLFALLSITLFGCSAKENCEADRGIKTPYGRLFSTQCTDEKGYPTRQWISLDGQKVLEDSFLSGDLAIDKSRVHWVFSGAAQTQTGCSSRIFLVDLSKNPVKVTAFGVKKACNEFHWASWGEKRSVIALKNNVKFTYETGRMILPAAGEKLWKSIEPPHAGTGLALEDAIPFAEDVPLPK